MSNLRCFTRQGILLSPPIIKKINIDNSYEKAVNEVRQLKEDEFHHI